MTMPHPRQKRYGDLDNWLSKSNGISTRYVYQTSRPTEASAEKLASDIESALGIPVGIYCEQDGDECTYWIETGYRPNCHLE